MTSTKQPRRRGNTNTVYLCTSDPCADFIAADRDEDDDSCLRCGISAAEHESAPDTAAEAQT